MTIFAAENNGEFDTDGIDSVNTVTGVYTFHTESAAHGPDGLVTGSGSLNGYIYANNNDGTVTEINLLTGQETVIASGGGRGDLAKVDQTNGSFLVGQNGPDVPPFTQGFAEGVGHLVRITPPLSGSFGAAVGRQVYVRDDIGHIDTTRKVTQTYSAFTADNSKTITDSHEATGFDLTGISGTAYQGTMLRSGSASFQTTGTFDLQWGVRSIVNPSLTSYGSAGVAVDLLPTNPYSYTLAWPLESVYLADISNQLGSVYHTLLTDQISSTCGTYQFSDQPQQNWPAQKNTLSLVVAHPQNLLTGMPGRSLDMTLAGRDAPSYGTWDIVSLGTTIASSGNPLGWDVEPDHTSFGGFIVTPPASVPVGVTYEVRSTLSGAVGSGSFTTQPVGSSLTAPVLLPLTVTPRVVMGGASATVQIALDAPAPLGGATVSLSSSDPSVTIQPAFVTIASGRSTATATAQTSSVSTATVATITASYNGTRTANLVILNANGIDTGGIDPGPGSGTGGTTLSGGVSGSGDGKTVGTPGLGGGTIISTLPAPTNLRAVGGDGFVTLTWNADPTHQAKRYNVGRSQTKGGPYALIFRGLTQPGYLDRSVINGQTYFYVVNAVSVNGESPLSNEASATPVGIPLADPTITPNGGVITAGTLVTLADATYGAVLYYTTDGSEPTTNSLLYTAPFPVTDNLTVKAKAFKTGLAPSRTVSAEFVIATAFPGTVTITAPTTGAAFVVGDSVPVTASVSNPSTSGVTFTVLDFYANGVLIGHSDGDHGTITWTPTVPGAYRLSAHALSSDGAQKLYSPQVFVTVTLPVAGTTLDCGQTVSGTLTTSDNISLALPDGQFADRYTFQGVAGETVILSLSSTNFDGYLALFDPNGTQVAANDDSLGQTNNSQIIYQVPTSGTYTVEATSYSPGQTGPYTLGLRCSPSGAAGQLSVSVDGVSIPNNGTVDFGSTPRSVPVTKTLVLTNTGNADLAITGTTGSGDWTIFPLGQNVISPGQSLSLRARFNADALGTTTGLLVLSNTTAVNPYTISLSGTATNGPTVTVIDFSVNPASVMSGTSTTATVTLSGAAPNGGQLIGLSSANTALVPLPASVIVPTGQTTYSFTVPTTAISFTSTVTLTAYIGTHAAPYSFAQTHLTLTPAGDPPTVTLDTPTNGGTYAAGTIDLTATAQTAGATITKVEFFNGTTKIGEDTSAPYTFNWINVGAGDYTLHAVATDSNGLTGRSADVLIHVSNLPAVATPTITPNGGTFTGSVSVTIADTDDGVTLFYTLDGTDPSTTSPRYTGAFVLPASATPIVVTARAFKQGYAPSASATATFTINPVAGLTAPTVSITSPSDGSEITGVPANSAVGKTSIIGSITSTALAYWTLEYQSVGDSNWVPFAQGTSVVNNATIGYLDTTLMLDGQYDIRLTAVDQAGQSAIPAIITIVIKGHQKVGYFTVSFTDMTIPIAGIPITITRTYDSRDKSNGDFGVGWTLSTTNAKVQKRQVSGYNWNQVRQGGGFSQIYVLKPVRPHLVTITLPGDTVYSFQETVSPYGQAFYPLDGTTVVYQQLSGPKATLNPVNADPNVFVGAPFFDEDPNTSSTAVELYDGSNPDQVYNPTEFVLTMHDGRQFDVNQSNGLQTITDRNGNVITFSYNGSGCTSISSQDGHNIVINHAGANGTISSIKDLNDNLAQYSTDGFGNLASYTDRVGNTMTFDYDYQHNLTDTRDPAGNIPLRNYYLPDGRLNYSLDSHDNKVSYYYDLNRLEPNTSLPQQTGIQGIPLSVPNNSEIVTDRVGNPTLISYDSYGNVTAKTRYLVDRLSNTAVPVTTSYTFGDANNSDKPTEVIDALQHKIDYLYDASGNLLSTTQYHTDLYGNVQKLVVSTTYNSFGGPLLVTDRNGVVVRTNIYDTSGNLLDSADALGSHSKFTYNPDGSLRSSIDAKNNITAYNYDRYGPTGNLIKAINALGQVISFTYDKNGNKISETVYQTTAQSQVAALTTLFTYDNNDRLLTTITPNQSSTQRHYNSLGQIDRSIDELGRVTVYEHDDLGLLTKTIQPDNTTVTIKYDADSRREKSFSASGHGLTYTYDSLGNLTVITLFDNAGNGYPDGHGGLIHTSKIYNVNNQLLSSTDENGNITAYSYDDLNRRTSVKDALGNVTSYQYDKEGRQIALTDGNQNTTTYEYDIVGNLIYTHYADGTTSSATYDQLGNRIAVTDQANHTTAYIYDALGQLLSVTNPMGYITRYTYDERGNKISQIDANNHVTLFTYDLSGQLISKTLPGPRIDGSNLTADWAYDLYGKVISATKFNGTVTNLIYDPLSDLLLGKQDINGNELVSYVYNSDNSRQSDTRYLATGNITKTYNYNSRGLLQKVTTYLGNQSIGNIAYEYDNVGNRTSVTTPSNKLSYSYDADNRLSKVQDTHGLVATYTYDKNGNRQSLQRGNGVSTVYTYNRLNRLTDVNNSIGSSFHYVLGFDGKRITVTNNSGTTSYTYNAAGWLLQESGSAGVIQYGYDNVGNRQTKTVNNSQIMHYSYDANDRLLSQDNITNTYDDDGNQTTINGQAATYDFENHLISVGTAIYTYDVDGHRVQTADNNSTVNYLIDDNRDLAENLEERDENNTLLASYDYGDDLISMSRSSNTYYYNFDGLGSTTALTDTTGAISDTYSYDVFGNVLSHSGTTVNSYLFNGQQQDSGTGLYYLRARYYDARNGRFMSQDPYSGSNYDPVSLHRYLYAGNDPIIDVHIDR